MQPRIAQAHIVPACGPALDLLAAIKEVTRPQSHRRIASGGRSATLGLTTMDKEPGLSAVTAGDAGRTLIRLFNQTLAQETHHLGFSKWTSAQVNLDGGSCEHRDSGCVGWSVAITLGKFTGGRTTMTEDSSYLDCRNTFVVFDGRATHRTEEFCGTDAPPPPTSMHASTTPRAPSSCSCSSWASPT